MRSSQGGAMDSGVPDLKTPCPRAGRLSGPIGRCRREILAVEGRGLAEAGRDLEHCSVSPDFSPSLELGETEEG